MSGIQAPSILSWRAYRECQRECACLNLIFYIPLRIRWVHIRINSHQQALAGRTCVNTMETLCHLLTMLIKKHKKYTGRLSSRDAVWDIGSFSASMALPVTFWVLISSSIVRTYGICLPHDHWRSSYHGLTLLQLSMLRFSLKEGEHRHIIPTRS